MKFEEFEDEYAKVLDEAYAEMPDLGTQDQFKIWDTVASKIPCNSNLAINNPQDERNIEELTIEDLKEYIQFAIAEYAFKELIDEINDDNEIYVINLNNFQDDGSRFNELMSSIVPPTNIEFTWSQVIENNQHYVDINIKHSLLREIAHKYSLTSELEATINNRIDPYYFVMLTCKSCGFTQIVKYTIEEYEKDQIIYHIPCGYPKGVFECVNLGDSTNKELNIININELSEDIKYGETWEMLMQSW